MGRRFTFREMRYGLFGNAGPFKVAGGGEESTAISENALRNDTHSLYPLRGIRGFLFLSGFLIRWRAGIQP